MHVACSVRGFVPEERHGHAAVTSLKLSDNLVLARSQSDHKAFLGGGFLNVIKSWCREAGGQAHLGSHGCAQERR